MNRHQEFEQSQFYISFKAIKEKIEELAGINISNQEILEQFSRLEKVIIYIDNYLNITDWDCVTPNELQNLYNHEPHLQNTFNNLVSFEQNLLEIQYIIQANAEIDVILPFIRNIIPPVLPKKGIQNVFKLYSDTLQRGLKGIDFDRIRQTNDLSKEIEKSKKIEKINSFFNEMVNGEDSLQNKVGKFYQSIEAVEGKVEESSNKQDELNTFYIKIFGELNEETQEREGGLKEEVENKRQTLSQYEEEQKTVIESLKKEVKEAMNDAITVHLVKSFTNEKKGLKRNVVNWNRAFMWAIAAIIVLSVWGFLGIRNEFSNSIDLINSIVLRLPIAALLVWLAIFCAKRRSESQMLLHEYTHKEAFASSYSSYKDQIEGLREEKDTLLTELLHKAIAVMARNPTSVLNTKHSSDLPAEEITKLVAKEMRERANGKQW